MGSSGGWRESGIVVRGTRERASRQSCWGGWYSSTGSVPPRHIHLHHPAELVNDNLVIYDSRLEVWLTVAEKAGEVPHHLEDRVKREFVVPHETAGFQAGQVVRQQGSESQVEGAGWITAEAVVAEELDTGESGSAEGSQQLGRSSTGIIMPAKD